MSRPDLDESRISPASLQADTARPLSAAWPCKWRSQHTLAQVAPYIGLAHPRSIWRLAWWQCYIPASQSREDEDLGLNAGFLRRLRRRPSLAGLLTFLQRFPQPLPPSLVTLSRGVPLPAIMQLLHRPVASHGPPWNRPTMRALRHFPLKRPSRRLLTEDSSRFSKRVRHRLELSAS